MVAVRLVSRAKAVPTWAAIMKFGKTACQNFPSVLALNSSGKFVDKPFWHYSVGRAAKAADIRKFGV